MSGIYASYCNLMKYVDLFVHPVWSYFREMSGFGLFLSTIVVIVIAAVLYYITDSCLLELQGGNSTVGVYLWICKLLFLPMVAFMGMIFTFEGMKDGNVFTTFFIRSNTSISLSNIAEWGMPFAEIILVVIAVRFFAALLYCVLKLDILELLRLLFGMLAALLVGMCVGRVLLSMMEADSHLIILLGNLLGLIISFAGALIFAIGLTAWIRDIFRPIGSFFLDAYHRADVTLVDKQGNYYHTNWFLLATIYLGSWRLG